MTRFFLAVFAALLLVSCAGSNEAPERPATITAVGWSAENIAPSYWDDQRTARIFYRFTISYSGTITPESIDYARVYLPHGKDYWTIYDEDETEFLDTDNKRLGVGGYWALSNKVAYRDHALPVGLLEAEIVFKNGTSTTWLFQTTIPGRTTNEGWDYVVTEDDPSPEMSTARTYAALKRPFEVALSADNNEETVTVRFRLDDERISQGSIAFLDDEGHYAGSFRREAWEWNATGNNLLVIPMAAIDLDGSESTVDTVADLKNHLAACYVVARNGPHSALSDRTSLQ